MQAVGELDQDHADIPRHGHRHFLEILGLCLGARGGFELRQLADAIDQFRHAGTKLSGQGFLADAGVLDHIVQQCRDQALMVHVHIGEDIGHRQRVGNVGLTGAPDLPVVRLLGIVIGTAHGVYLFRCQVGV